MPKILCPNCHIECDPYRDYETIGECPKCNGIFTIASGNEVEVRRYEVRNGVSKRVA